MHVKLEKPKDKENEDEAPGYIEPKGSTGIATFNMKVTSEYLFVGDGCQDYSDQYEEAYHTFFRSKGQLTVPGSSLKGAVRCVAEAISASCVGVKSWNDRRKLGREYPKCKVPRGPKKVKICPACRIFGTTGYKGHITFSDALLNASIRPEIIKIAELWRPRKLILKRKFYKSGKYIELEDQSPEQNYRYIEVIPKNSIFTFNLFFENTDDFDLSLLFHAMGINQDFEIKVGGAKPRCLGNVSFELKKIKIIEKLIDSKEEDPESFVNKKLAKDKLIITDRLEELSRKISSKTTCTGG